MHRNHKSYPKLFYIDLLLVKFVFKFLFHFYSMDQLDEWEDKENLAPEYMSVIIVSGIIFAELFIYFFIFMKT